MTTSWEIWADQIRQAIEPDHTRIAHDHGQGPGGTWPTADMAESSEAYLLDQETEQKRYRAIHGGYRESRNGKEINGARVVEGLRIGPGKRTVDAQGHVRRDRGVMVRVGEGEDHPKGYGGGKTSAI